MKRMLAIAFGMSLLFSICCTYTCRAQGDTTLREEKGKDSYSIGYEFGVKVKAGSVEVDKDLLFSGIQDALEGKKPALSPDELRETLLNVRKKIMVLQDQRFRELSAQSLKDGQEFLVANKAKKGVVTLPSGLQYKVLTDGKGRSPKPNESVTVRYRGTLVDGTEFDSTHRRDEPTTLNVSGVIPGWTEALQRMKAGSKWQVFVPSGLAYGERRFGVIPPNSTLIFELELVSIGKGKASTAPPPAAAVPPAEQPSDETGEVTDSQPGG